MKPTFILAIAISIAFVRCGNKNNTSSADTVNTTIDSTAKAHSDSIMPDTTVIIQNNETNNTTNTSTNISGSAWYKNKYCGGMRPTPEVENQYNKEYVVPSCKLKFINNNTVVYATTDANGNFNAPLTAGTWNYTLVSTQGSGLPIDMSCEKYFDHSYGSVEISDKKNNPIRLLFAFPCDPCDPYSNMRP